MGYMTGEQPQQIRGVHNLGRIRDEGKEFPKRAASTSLEGESYSQSYGTFGLSSVGKRYSCKNCQRRHGPPLCGCPNCEGSHLISKCPFSGILEGETVPKTGILNLGIGVLYVISVIRELVRVQNVENWHIYLQIVL